VQAYVEQLRQGGYKLRYTGTMAADVHRLLRYGGIYMHPADVTGESARGKIRLLFEAIPLGFIVDNGGGVATDGRQSILECVPQHLHEQIPVVFGDSSEIALFSAQCGSQPSR
jgi:fructose-1,6-bisphosphatase I